MQAIGHGLLGLTTPELGTPHSDINDSPMFVGIGARQSNVSSKSSNSLQSFNRSGQRKTTIEALQQNRSGMGKTNQVKRGLVELFDHIEERDDCQEDDTAELGHGTQLIVSPCDTP